VVAATYRMRVTLGSDEARTGGMLMSALSSSSAYCISSV
jgi:hypothetical protein